MHTYTYTHILSNIQMGEKSQNAAFCLILQLIQLIRKVNHLNAGGGNALGALRVIALSQPLTVKDGLSSFGFFLHFIDHFLFVDTIVKLHLLFCLRHEAPGSCQYVHFQAFAWSLPVIFASEHSPYSLGSIVMYKTFLFSRLSTFMCKNSVSLLIIIFYFSMSEL